MSDFAHLQIHHLSFLGPNRPPATVRFEAGFNVLYGASDTGKSFILDSIDYTQARSRRVSFRRENSGRIGAQSQSRTNQLL
jgi:DNA repair ATPase RecN